MKGRHIGSVGFHQSGRWGGQVPSRPSVAVWAAVGRFASFERMVAQARYFSSRRHVDLRRVGTAICRRSG
ncbi:MULTISPECIES: putative leader peptide [unclassified Streptomyces]|uniref:putative leader peptide n=1 Tax=unclassified Streptomyces TaxID=2593676 RepID=UPI003866291C